eukprot:488722-Rhodomonas_salina.1
MSEHAKEEKRRSYLTQHAVLELFKQRPQRSEDGQFVPSTACSKALAKQFKIADKTIRDIWNRRSWAKVTRPLWTEAEILGAGIEANVCNDEASITAAKTRGPGRPKGAKDTVTRRKKTTKSPSESSPPSPPTLPQSAEEKSVEEIIEDFCDPFVDAWKRKLTALDLTTMVDASD